MKPNSTLEALLDQERLVAARRVHWVRLVAVGFVSALFVGLRNDPAWNADLRVVGLWTALAVAVALAGRVKSLSPWVRLAPALLDVPAVYWLQAGQLPTTPQPAGVAGFTLGVFVFLLVIAELTMRAWQVWFTVAACAVAMVALQAKAGVSAGAMVAAVVVLSLAGSVLSFSGRRTRERLALLSRQEKLATLGRLSASVGHDLRSPLSTITNSLFVIRRQAEKAETRDEKLLTAVGLAERESAASARIVKDMLDFTHERVEAEEVEVQAFLDECVGILRKSESVSVTAESKVTAPVKLVRDRLRQVLVNLLQNGAEAMPPGRAGSVRCTARQDGTFVIFEVRDDGIGFSAEAKRHLFEPLYTTKKEGTGLGLSIVDALVRQMNGTLSLESQPGQGSTFTVRVPVG